MKKNKKFKSNKKKRFSNSKLYELVIKTFRENPNKRLNYKQIAKILKIKEMGIKVRLVEIMKELASSNLIEEIQRGSYRIFEKRISVFGKIIKTNNRGVYIELDAENIVFVNKEKSFFVLTGDKVEVLVFTVRKNKKEAEIVSVVERKKDVFVGVIDNSSSNYFLIPDDKSIYFDVFLPANHIRKDYLQKKVLVHVDGWDNKYKNPIGKVTSVIGEINDIDSEIKSIVFDYGFFPNFSKSIDLAANKIGKEISTKEIKNRLDIRKTPSFTIDPIDAKDFDDALSVKKLKNKNWQIGVHIADVSHYVLEDSVLDKEAFNRSTSIYLVDRVIPMLPEILSNDICSLKPNVDRLAFSILFEINNDGDIIDYIISKTIIHSDYRFSYEEAQNIINKKTGHFVNELVILEKISLILRKKREENGSINFKSNEIKFILDKEKNPIDICHKKTLSTNRLIEEFMLLANKTISKHVSFLKSNFFPVIYRIHDVPDNDKIISLNNLVKKFGYNINNVSPKSLSKSLNVLLKNTKGKSEQQLIETLTVRSMSKAVYSTKNIGHYGLGFNYYSHFTSPIRRYPDLILHRILDNHLSKKQHINQKTLDKICKYCSEKEKTAARAERDSIKYMQVKFLKNKIGEIYNGVISGVTEWGLYVELTDNTCEGLVRIGSITDDHYIYDEKKHALIGYNKKNIYQLGQNVKIKIQRTNQERKQIDFVLV